MRIPFTLRGIAGHVHVSIAANTNPAEIGYALLFNDLATDFARGFPICRASVVYPATGYAAVFGWTQMVRSSDQNARP